MPRRFSEIDESTSSWGLPNWSPQSNGPPSQTYIWNDSDILLSNTLPVFMDFEIRPMTILDHLQISKSITAPRSRVCLWDQKYISWLQQANYLWKHLLRNCDKDWLVLRNYGPDVETNVYVPGWFSFEAIKIVIEVKRNTIHWPVQTSCTTYINWCCEKSDLIWSMPDSLPSADVLVNGQLSCGRSY